MDDDYFSGADAAFGIIMFMPLVRNNSWYASQMQYIAYCSCKNAKYCAWRPFSPFQNSCKIVVKKKVVFAPLVQYA